MDPAILDTNYITDVIAHVDAFVASPIAAPAAADLRAASTEMRKLPAMIIGIVPGMVATKTELEYINSQKSDLLTPVNAMVAELEVTRTVSVPNNETQESMQTEVMGRTSYKFSHFPKS